MLSDIAKSAVIIFACLTITVLEVHPAELYWAEHARSSLHQEQPWQKMPLRERAKMLTNEAIIVALEGVLAPGDFDQLMKLHSLVPVHTIFIRSPGGSVPEALKIAQFVSENHIEVDTDLGCDGPGDGRPFCGCASSCALIWLAAPLRHGFAVKVHRPYFESPEFQNLPDSVALQRYNEATSQVRVLLQSKGYSQEFINHIFAIPREQARALTLEELRSLPIDAALDELISARCYHGNEQQIAEYSEIKWKIAQLAEDMEQFIGKLRDPVSAQEQAKLDEMYKRDKALRANAAKLEKLNLDFIGCKIEERIQASIRKSGAPRLTPKIREKLKTFSRLVNFEHDKALEIMSKALTDREMGRHAGQELVERQEQLRTISAELRSELPPAHLEFLASALH